MCGETKLIRGAGTTNLICEGIFAHVYVIIVHKYFVDSPFLMADEFFWLLLYGSLYAVIS